MGFSTAKAIARATATGGRPNSSMLCRVRARETVAPALLGVVWLGDRARDGLGRLVVLGFVIAVTGTLALARFGEAPQPAEAGEAVT